MREPRPGVQPGRAGPGRAAGCLRPSPRLNTAGTSRRGGGLLPVVLWCFFLRNLPIAFRGASDAVPLCPAALWSHLRALLFARCPPAARPADRC